MLRRDFRAHLDKGSLTLRRHDASWLSGTATPFYKVKRDLADFRGDPVFEDSPLWFNPGRLRWLAGRIW